MSVLFEITEAQLETGMRGYPVGYCTTSKVDPHKGLFYKEQAVSELASRTPEEVIYLLYFGHLPNREELTKFKNDLNRRSHCSSEVLEAIRKLPHTGQPMALFSCALLILGMFEGTGDYHEDGLNVVAKAPQIVATLINSHSGWGEGKVSDPTLGYMENFTEMLGLPQENRKNLTEVFKLFNILHYDHGGGNLSTFTGKTVASGQATMYESLSAAMNALAGHRHGKANQDSLQLVQKVVEQLNEHANEETVEKYLREKLEKKELIYGFGHAVLRVEDPRATLFYQLADEHYPDNPLVKMAHLLRVVASKVLSENEKITDPHPNVDAISGTVLHAAGFAYPEYYTLLFGLSRLVGISRQIIYERHEARGGKGVPIVRPKYLYRAEE